MRMTFDLEIKPYSDDDQDKLDAIGAALDVLILHVSRMRRRLSDGLGIEAEGESEYGGKSLHSEEEILSVTVIWKSESIRPN
jgi:hypothetical protein